MASKKYLDKGGLEHTWTKIKSWVNTQLAGKANSSHTHTYSQITDLSSWKTTNFGTGTYSNNGSLIIRENAQILFGSDNNDLVVQFRKGDLSTYNFRADMSGNKTNNKTINCGTELSGIAFANFTMSDTAHKISFSKSVDYIIISKAGVKSGSGTSYTYDGKSPIFIIWASSS